MESQGYSEALDIESLQRWLLVFFFKTSREENLYLFPPVNFIISSGIITESTTDSCMVPAGTVHFSFQLSLQIQTEQGIFGGLKFINCPHLVEILSLCLK